MTTRDDAAYVHREWHDRTVTRDIEGLLSLYREDAVLESPLVPRVMDVESGVLRGHDDLREFFRRGTHGRPLDRVRFHREDHFFFDNGRLVWEYPRETPEGSQLELVEVMDLAGRSIWHHRIYWGWSGLSLLTG